jgi:hypothetical protein
MESTMKPTSDWRSVIKVHPAADLFPMMSPDELATLTEDIRANGLRNLIATWFDENEQEWLIDGRNRLEAMAAIGYLFSRGRLERETPQLFIYEPGRRGDLPVQHHDGVGTYSVDPYTLAISFNINRRHLTTAQKSELITKLLKVDPTKSDRAVAEVVKVDHKTVGAKRAALKAGGEIPHVDAKRVGADGKTYKQPTKPAAVDKDAVKATTERLADLGEFAAPPADIGAEFAAGILAGAALEDPPVAQRLHALMHIVDDLTKLANGDKRRLDAVAKLDRARDAIATAFMGGS